jgi:hypothetical protein
MRCESVGATANASQDDEKILLLIRSAASKNGVTKRMLRTIARGMSNTRIDDAVERLGSLIRHGGVSLVDVRHRKSTFVVAIVGSAPVPSPRNLTNGFSTEKQDDSTRLLVPLHSVRATVQGISTSIAA